MERVQSIRENRQMNILRISPGLALFFATSLACASAQADGIKACEELKSEIAAKLDAKNVVGYTLEIVANADVGERKVVGSCEGGKKKIVYTRN
jgi:hypothetical protein